MKRILQLDLADLYIMAMLLEGWRLVDISRHLGYAQSWTTQHVIRIRKIYGEDMFYRDKSLKLTEQGATLAKNCALALNLIAPDYSRPTKAKPKIKPIKYANLVKR